MQGRSSRRRSRSSRCRSSCPGCSTTTASSTRATPAPILGICLSVIDNEPYAGTDRFGVFRCRCRLTVTKTSLVANRARSPRRVFRTCRTLGIATVAVHSDADAALPVRRARPTSPCGSPATRPPRPTCASTLSWPRRRRPAPTRSTPATASSSENADFARAVIDAGLTWVGPTPESIEAMGSKIEAKKLMADGRRPGAWQAPDDGRPRTTCRCWSRRRPAAAAAACGSSRRLADLAGEIAARAAEAASAFGDGTVFVEPYVEHGRHVEVQVVGDTHGVLVLGERDCSIQRRHQKVVEEAPAPACRDEVRAALHDAAPRGGRGDRLPRRRHGRVPLRRRRPSGSGSWR